MYSVFHVSDVDAYRTAESKVRNLLGDDTLDLDGVTVVVDRPAVVDAVALDCIETTEELARMGAVVKLCSNSFRGADTTAEDLSEHVELVSSGVGELTRLQNQGWAYIRL